MAIDDELDGWAPFNHWDEFEKEFTADDYRTFNHWDEFDESQEEIRKDFDYGMHRHWEE